MRVSKNYRFIPPILCKYLRRSNIMSYATLLTAETALDSLFYCVYFLWLQRSPLVFQVNFFSPSKAGRTERGAGGANRYICSFCGKRLLPITSLQTAALQKSGRISQNTDTVFALIFALAIYCKALIRNISFAVSRKCNSRHADPFTV